MLDRPSDLNVYVSEEVQIIDHNHQNKNRHVSYKPVRLDSTDLQLIDLLMSGTTSRECAKILNKPLSTIQRRARLLIQREILKPTFELGYTKLAMQKGFLHVYLNGGDISETIDKLLTREGIFSASAHLGNSDIVALFLFKESMEVMDLISWTKNLDGVERVVWSQEIYQRSTSPKIEKIIPTVMKAR